MRSIHWFAPKAVTVTLKNVTTHTDHRVKFSQRDVLYVILSVVL